MSNFVILPDSARNSISETDITKGIFRITTSSKHLFHNCPTKVLITIKSENYECTYWHRDGRSDTLSIGKAAITNLNLKEGNSIRITKVGNLTYQVEKI